MADRYGDACGQGRLDGRRDWPMSFRRVRESYWNHWDYFRHRHSDLDQIKMKSKAFLGPVDTGLLTVAFFVLPDCLVAQT